MVGAVSRIQFSLDRLIAEAQRRMKRRRLVVAALLIALISGAGITLALRESGGSSTLAVGALKLTTPPGFLVHPLQFDGQRVGFAVSDYRWQTFNPSTAAGIFPGNRVGLAFLRALEGAQLAVASGRARPQALRLPLSLNELQGPQRHADGTAWSGLFQFHGQLYTATFWVGDTAPQRDRAALLRALTSIHRAH
jgi:hypothetical protein